MGISNEERKRSSLERQMGILDRLSRGFFYLKKVRPNTNAASEFFVPKELNVFKNSLETFSKKSFHLRQTNYIEESINNIAKNTILSERYTSFELSGSEYASDRPLTTCTVNSFNNLFLGNIGGDVSCWDMSTFKKFGSSNISKTKIVSILNVNDSCNFAACFDGMVYRQSNLSEWTLWSKLDARLNGVFFNKRIPYLASSDSSGSFRILDLESAITIQKKNAHDSGCYAIDFHVDGALMGTTGMEGDSKIWDLRCGECIFSVKRHKNVSIHFRPSGYEILFGSIDGALRNYDMRNLQFVNEQSIHTSNITKIVNTGDALILSSLDGRLSIVNHQDLSVIKYLEGHEGRISACCYSLHSDSIFSCGYDKTWKVWNKI